jgi:hypothetical protein
MCLKLARKIDEAANFVFVQLIEQEPGILILILYFHIIQYNPGCGKVKV